jgi:predicted nicotinamide N-methyase
MSSKQPQHQQPQHQHQQDDDDVTKDVQEEDWSDIMTSDLSAGSFARHDDVQDICLPDGILLKIASAASLSPLDMMDLSWGTHDATGHCIWMGAKLFLQALPKLQVVYLFSDAHCRILELGSGTGLAGIAVAKTQEANDTSLQQLHIVLTDNSDSALALCRHNCKINGVAQKVRVEFLSWGNTLLSSSTTTPRSSSHDFDIVLATDVLYDIGAWEPLLQTVTNSLREKGHLILSHVPRAALPEGTLSSGSSSSSLEDHLVAIAKGYQLHLVSTLHPSDLEEFEDWQEMEQAGASILIFGKVSTTGNVKETIQ